MQEKKSQEGLEKGIQASSVSARMDMVKQASMCSSRALSALMVLGGGCVLNIAGQIHGIIESREDVSQLKLQIFLTSFFVCCIILMFYSCDCHCLTRNEPIFLRVRLADTVHFAQLIKTSTHSVRATAQLKSSTNTMTSPRNS